MRIKQKITGSILAGLLLAPLPLQTALASTGVIYISPASSNLRVGSSETISLRISPGTAVSGVQATVSFNSSQLRLNSVDDSGSPFGTQLQKSVGASSVSLQLGDLTGTVSSDALIATMNFTALASSGTATLSISNANAAISGSYTNPSVSNGTISFSPKPAPSSPSPHPASHTTTPAKTTTPASGSGSASASSGGGTTVTPLVTPHLSAKLAAKLTSATLTVSSDQNESLYAVYGTSTDSLTSKTSTVSNAKSATLALGDPTPLTPGTTYYYQVVAVDANGTQTKLDVRHFTTKGYTVAVTILGKDNQPLAHYKVSLHSAIQTIYTDTHGVAKFTGVAPGEHHVTYQDGQKTYSAVVFVDNSAASAGSTTAAMQTAAVILPVTAGQKSGVSPAAAVITLLSLAVVTLATLLLLECDRKRLKALRSLLRV